MPTRLRVAARLGAWALAVATLCTGVGLTVSRTLAIATTQPGSAESYEIRAVDVSVVGLSLLVVGLVLLGALLMLEGYGRSSADH